MSSRGTSNSGPTAETAATEQYKRVTIDKTSSIAFRCVPGTTCCSSSSNNNEKKTGLTGTTGIPSAKPDRTPFFSDARLSVFGHSVFTRAHTVHTATETTRHAMIRSRRKVRSKTARK